MEPRLLHQHEPGGVLVLDEPTAPLDPRHASILLGLLRTAADDGATVLLSMPLRVLGLAD